MCPAHISGGEREDQTMIHDPRIFLHWGWDGAGALVYLKVIKNKGPGIGEHLKSHSHRAKANLKAKKIKEQSEEFKEKNLNLKENFRFLVCFHSVWTNP